MAHEHTKNNPFIKGTHKTEDEAVRVPFFNSFSLEVPQGFIFESPEHTGNEPYFLRAVSDDGKSSFDRLEKASKSFILHEFRIILVPGFDAEDMEDVLTNVIDEYLDDGKVIDLVYHPNLIIKYFTKKKSANILQYKCFVCFMCQIVQIDFYFNGTKLDEKDCKTFAEGIMRSVKVIAINEKLTPSVVSEIKENKKYTFTFKTNNRVKFDGWSILVPDNFSTRTDIPNTPLLAAFNDGNVDINDSNPNNILADATISFIVSKNLMGKGNDHDLSDARIKSALVNAVIQNNLLQQDSHKTLFASEPSYFLFYQLCYTQSYDGMIYKAMLVTKGGLYQIAANINLKSDKFTFNHREYEKKMLQLLTTIEIDDKKIKPFSVDEADSAARNPRKTIKTGSIIEFSSYKWRVLDTDDDAKILVISEDILEMRPYHRSKTDVTWETCDLRKYLNGEFLNKLNKEKIIPVVNHNTLNLFTQTDGGNDTKDSVFIPGLLEVAMYFGKESGIFDGFYRGKGNGKSVSTGSMTLFISEDENSKRIARDSNGKPCEWWLRTPGGAKDHAVIISDDGEIQMRGSYVTSGGNIGVRPALWLSRDTFDESDITPVP